MGESGEWELLNSRQRCANLTPAEADSIFFPGPGGKVSKARRYCSSCPVKGLCLEQAIKLNLQGFWSGTTLEERNEMAKFKAEISEQVRVDSIVDPYIPNLTRRRALRKVVISKPYEYLDVLEEPTMEELIIEDLVLMGELDPIELETVTSSKTA